MTERQKAERHKKQKDIKNRKTENRKTENGKTENRKTDGQTGRERQKDKTGKMPSLIFGYSGKKLDGNNCFLILDSIL
jgi:hypothetical protein